MIASNFFSLFLFIKLAFASSETLKCEESISNFFDKYESNRIFKLGVYKSIMCSENVYMEEYNYAFVLMQEILPVDDGTGIISLNNILRVERLCKAALYSQNNLIKFRDGLSLCFIIRAAQIIDRISTFTLSASQKPWIIKYKREIYRILNLIKSKGKYSSFPSSISSQEFSTSLNEPVNGNHLETDETFISQILNETVLEEFFAYISNDFDSACNECELKDLNGHYAHFDDVDYDNNKTNDEKSSQNIHYMLKFEDFEEEITNHPNISTPFRFKEI